MWSISVSVRVLLVGARATFVQIEFLSKVSGQPVFALVCVRGSNANISG